MHDCTHQLYTGNRELVLFQPVLKTYPCMSLLDNHSTCITREQGETMETVYQTDDKDPSTITLSNMETCSSNIPIE